MIKNRFDRAAARTVAFAFIFIGCPSLRADPLIDSWLTSYSGKYARVYLTDADKSSGNAVPSLRNVELTGPYMHDGRFQSLEEAVEHYATGIKRSATLDPNLAKHPDGGVPLSADDKRALVAFLKTLTDERLRAEKNFAGLVEKQTTTDQTKGQTQ